MLYKVYSAAGVYKKTLTGDSVVSKLSYATQINGGQGACVISSSLSYDDTSISIGDIFKVRDDTTLLYTGFVSQIKRKFTTRLSTIDYNCLGLASLFAQTIYSSAGTYTFNKNQEPKTTLEDIISQVNVNFNFFTSTIATFGSTVSINFTGQNCLQALNKVIEITGRKRHIDALGVFRCGPDGSFTTHLLTLQQDVESVEINDDGDTLSNYLILNSSVLGISLQNDAASVTSYGQRQTYIENSSIADTAAKNAYVTAYFLDLAQPKSKMSMVVNRNYSLIDTIRPGDIINIRNTTYNLRSLKVYAVKRGVDKVQLDIKAIDNYTQIMQS